MSEDTLRAALAPFVAHYAPWMDEHPDDAWVTVHPRVTFGQLRAARDALAVARTDQCIHVWANTDPESGDISGDYCVYCKVVRATLAAEAGKTQDWHDGFEAGARFERCEAKVRAGKGAPAL